MRTRMTMAGRLAVGVACMALTATAAMAQGTWNERTVLKFDEPVMIPGKTLQPGTYVFKLADQKGGRNLMQVYTKDQQNLLDTVVTVPIKRTKANGDVVLKFADVRGERPVALKAFFYPGTRYGHEFVYSDREAQRIARQTHKVVLSRDVDDSNMERGTLHMTDEAGNRTAWRENPDVAREWNAWIVTWEPTAQTPSAVGTSGRTDTGQNAHATMTVEQHADAIQRLVNQALDGTGSTVTVDRATLQQIRAHAEAIAGARQNRKPSGGR